MKDQSGEYFWYHNDHLGTPQMMTTSSGAVVWKAKYSSFGKATVDPSSTIDNPLRFPGQYEDAETGQHYNWHRYYNADLGRFITADPIGFDAGDENFYVYLWNDPINWIDPSGLSSESGNIPGSNIDYHIHWREQPTPDMHINWPDGSETNINYKGGWNRGKHRGKTLVRPPKKYRKPLRKIVKRFVKKAGKMIPVVGIIFWISDISEVYALMRNPCSNFGDYINVFIPYQDVILLTQL